ncbi:arginyl-tRNA synthetase [Ascobolus immersus RN42]|uniref:arginine--tRNA ligase n=1 Tax=Ascobolus immersus RN42 TaxID=1160509 RepID=A0A3N4HU79_ASCIM|nr:arginyl-tRNA synthetase [Ascobolus immersus RN42]
MSVAPVTSAPSLEELSNKLSSLGLKDPLPKFEGSNPSTNPVDIYRCYIADQLAPITGVDAKVIYPGLEWTSSFEKGDLVLAVPRLRLKGKPQDLAAEFAAKFPENPYTEKVTVQGTFLQFFFKAGLLSKIVIPQVLELEKKYGPAPTGTGKRIIVEFSSPNIAKPFHAGHLRSTIIGGFLANLYEAFGWDVIRMNYLGDWGKQFGLLAVGYQRFGDEEKLKNDPIHHLYQVYVQINKVIEEENAELVAKQEEAKKTGELLKVDPNQKGPTDNEARAFFARMEAGDQEALGLWKKFRDLSIEKYKDTYARLNITYDVYSGESMVAKESMEKAAVMMKEKGVSEESEGAVIVDFTKFGKEFKKLGKAVVMKKDGTTLYLTRDIGAAVERYEKYKFDKMIYVVASQQDLHLAQLFKIMKELGYEWADRMQHINFGMVLGMSTRKGTVVFLDDILQEAKDTMHEVMKKNEVKYAQVEDPEYVADTVGRAGVMIQDMSGKRINNYKFEMDRMTSFEGDTGPYLQYAHARLCSIARKANIPREELEKANLEHLTEPQATKLLRALAQYPDVLVNTMKTLEPTTIVTYLFKMTHLLSSSYEVLLVVNEKDREVATARMALYEAARIVLNNGMRMLGLTPVERM